MEFDEFLSFFVFELLLSCFVVLFSSLLFSSLLFLVVETDISMISTLYELKLHDREIVILKKSNTGSVHIYAQDGFFSSMVMDDG